MSAPCNQPVDCPGFDGSPVINNSSEAPDVVTFLGESWGPNRNPPLGWSYGPLVDYSTCRSPVSQAVADQCAADLAGPGVTDSWAPPSAGPPGSSFKNKSLAGRFVCLDGNSTFYEVPAGKFTAGSQAAADEAAQDWGNQQAALHQLCFSDLPSPVCQGSELSLNIFATSAFLAPPGVNTWSILDGALPPGLTFNGPATGPATITGTPTTPGDYQFVIGLTLPNGDTNSKQFFMTVAGVTAPLPNGMTGTAYNATLATSGFANPGFQLASGSLPAGITMDDFGTFSGTPTKAGTSNFSVLVQDAVTRFTCTQDVSITVTAGGLNFNDLVWGAPVVVTDPGTTAAATVAQNHGVGDASGDGTNPGSEGRVTVLGTLIYTGPNVNGLAHMVTDIIGVFGNTYGEMELTVDQDGNVLMDQIHNSFGTDSFTSDIPFTVVAGVNSVITVTFHVLYDSFSNIAIGTIHSAFNLTPAS